MTKPNKPREFWITPDLFAYNYEHIEHESGKILKYTHAIEHQAYTDALKMLEEMAQAIELMLDIPNNCYAQKNCEIVLKSYRNFKGEKSE